jgi:hypothetical protein
MDSESDKPLRLFVNPFALWTQVALKAHFKATRAKLRSKANAKRSAKR